jgi:hypothetical protein
MTEPVISKSAAAPKANAKTRPADLSVGIRATFPLGRSTKLLSSTRQAAPFGGYAVSLGTYLGKGTA